MKYSGGVGDETREFSHPIKCLAYPGAAQAKTEGVIIIIIILLSCEDDMVRPFFFFRREEAYDLSRTAKKSSLTKKRFHK